MLAKCVSTNCPKSPLCKRALSDSTAHVLYKQAGCNEVGGYKWFVEIEKTVSESVSEGEVLYEQ
jgi:hypothetical protein